MREADTGGTQEFQDRDNKEVIISVARMGHGHENLRINMAHHAAKGYAKETRENEISAVHMGWKIGAAA